MIAMRHGNYSAGRRRQGAALIVVLWVVMVASLLLLGMQRTTQTSAAIAHAEVGVVQARWLARAGVERAIAVLNDDLTTYEGPNDYWYDDPISFQAVELGPVDGGYMFDVTAPPDESDTTNQPRYGVVDAASKLNINTVDEDQIRKLPDLTPAQADSILDWRDDNTQANPGGAEARYYASLDYPYEIRNGPLRTERELMLVSGIDEQAYFGEDVNLNGLVDPNENDGSASWPDDRADGVLERGLAHRTTVYSYEYNRTTTGEQRVNVNQADAETLKAKLHLSDELANGLIERRGQNQFNSLADLLDVRPAQSQGSGGRRGRRGGESQSQSASSSDDAQQVNRIDLDWLAKNLENITLSNDERLPGRININTASKLVLETLPQIDAAAADAIVTQRRSSQGTFAGVGELHTRGVLDERQFRAVIDRVTVHSNVFEVTSRGRTPQGISRTLYAVVDRSGDTPRILYWHESE